MLTTVGWFGAIFLGVCSIPQAIKSYREGHSEGLSWAFIILWFLGEVLTLIYVIPQRDYPLIFNYLANLGLMCIMIKYKVWPRAKPKIDNVYIINDDESWRERWLK